VSEHIFAKIDSAGPDASWEKREGDRRYGVFELKLGVDIILDADGKYFVEAVTTTAGDVVHEWTEGPFDRTPRPASARSGGTPYV
jgi:hypothetical protein